MANNSHFDTRIRRQQLEAEMAQLRRQIEAAAASERQQQATAQQAERQQMQQAAAQRYNEQSAVLLWNTAMARAAKDRDYAIWLQQVALEAHDSLLAERAAEEAIHAAAN